MARTAPASSSSSSSSSSIDPRQLRGLKRLKRLLPMLASLRDVGCDRDAAGNRQLHFDQYVTLVLLYLFNPLLNSMRDLQQAAAIERVSDQLGVKRFSLGSFSESVRVFDPAKLKAVIRQLAGELKPVNADPRLKPHLRQHALKLVDGTVLDAIAAVASAMWLPFQDGTVKHAWRLHVQLDFDTFVPADADAVELTDARDGGKSDEKHVLRTTLKPDCCYVMDRWFAQFTPFNEIDAIGGSYVCRAKENSAFEVVEERLLSGAALKAGVVRDAVVRMGLHSKPDERPDHPIRLIVIEATPHAKRGGRRGKTAGPGNKGTIVIATNLLDVPAEVIALIDQHRWAIEVFFRFFKQVLGCRHLLSQRPEGILIEVYCAVIACMLINLWTGRRPDKRTVQMLAFYFMGVATEAEVLAHLNRPDRTGVKLRAKAGLWKKLGY
jgi:DDE family transposase